MIKDKIIKHQKLPFRCNQELINEVVESKSLRCTHFDAYRHFSSSAIPLNMNILERKTQSNFDQPGCVHVHMDLFK